MPFGVNGFGNYLLMCAKKAALVKERLPVFLSLKLRDCLNFKRSLIIYLVDNINFLL